MNNIIAEIKNHPVYIELSSYAIAYPERTVPVLKGIEEDLDTKRIIFSFNGFNSDISAMVFGLIDYFFPDQQALVTNDQVIVYRDKPT